MVNTVAGGAPDRSVEVGEMFLLNSVIAMKG